ncbi:MAG: hypothetical protein EXR98_17760 [Gemmataceae bacterium]|nr:hypothetical protein [Gemmataceae bacterium]
MKYIAILKDSIREALDSRVLYVMFVLSALVILAVSSMSFKLLPAERTMKMFFFEGLGKPPLIPIAINARKIEKMADKDLNRTFDDNIRFRFEKVELLKGEADAPESEYALTAKEPNGVDLKGDNDQQSKAAMSVLRSIFQDAEDFGYLRIGAVELLEPSAENKTTARYRITLQGTGQMRRIWASEPSLAFGAVPLFPDHLIGPLGLQLFGFAKLILGMGSWAAVLIGVVITSFFFPNMLRKGTVDLLLVKPIYRWLLVLYKYIGGLTFIFLCTAFPVGGIWFVLGIRTGVWANGMLLLILSTTFFFAILYAISTFVGIATRSTVTAILLTIGFWFGAFGVGAAHREFDMVRIREEFSEKHNRPIDPKDRWGDGNLALTFRTLHAIAPRTEDLNLLNDLIVYTDFMTGNLADMNRFDTSKRNWWETLLVSGAWIAVFLGLSVVWFSFKDY